ncbi:AGE family epimerase/isomerase [Tessaracoccus sp. ZS01]|uniref:AGE family epimerase/isomerase n=1 Tax=Tessaracoccus sp. ZS01 TaxID=1906324 RepID=UPI00096CF03F|nr:AGE family epimerase/isomerase [Tessaracoccus sp. ZS01]MCG6568782.1 AGE family epimerase/isomerase [Tessaracoccus sp. ZS01]OMG51693.1 N-acyl-D-glucosamine 2-epimerase [Tessaracoccus sp. ZS01]
MTDWLTAPTHRAWLQQETERLLAFGAAAPVAGQGAAYLDARGVPDPTRPIETWVTCRMVHVYSLGHLMGVPGSRPLAIRAMSGLTDALHDERHGGWFHTSARDGGKQAYDHAFVVLAGSSATVAGLPGGRELLDDALAVLDERFWDEAHGMVADAAEPDWSSVDPYRGINANMHTVEAMLAAADATWDQRWLERAERIASFARHQAAVHDWRLPEHYDDTWQPQLEYNDAQPEDPFRPYGATIGHGLEWARLFLHLEAATNNTDGTWLDAAQHLYDQAITDGWGRDGAEGFVYTTGWDGTPVTTDRLHWVAAEAIGAAAALFHRTGDKRYAADYSRWWDHVAEHFIDPEHGSWHHQLDGGLRVATSVWPGKPDIYHALQATLIPRLPLAPQMAMALAQRQLV